MSALSETMEQLLPPSSSIARPILLATFSYMVLPVFVDPVNDTSLSLGSLDIHSPPSDPLLATGENICGAPSLSRTLEMTFITPTAAREALVDGFHTTVSPHTAATMAFQDHTEDGKLKALITAMGPSGCHCSYSL